MKLTQFLLFSVFLLISNLSVASSTEKITQQSPSIISSPPSGSSIDPSISADGRYVTFQSGSGDLVADDSNETIDIFVYDRNTGVTELVSVDSSGAQSNARSNYPAISADGQYVAFSSDASNLVTGDTNGVPDIFVHNRDTGVTERVSIDSSGNQVNNGSIGSSISSDGRYVAFISTSSNLVTGDSNDALDIFVHDRNTGQTERVSLDSSGNQSNNHSTDPFISADGRYVSFRSAANNLVMNDTNGIDDIFIYDRDTDTTERVSVDSSGNQGNDTSSLPSISADGRYVTFKSSSNNLVSSDTNGASDIFVRDRSVGTTERVSVDSSGGQGNKGSNIPSISSDGRYVTFESLSSNLVSNDSNDVLDIFIHDQQTGATERVSIDSSGNQSNNISLQPAISADGRYVAFHSSASNLVTGYTLGNNNIFVHDREKTTTDAASKVGISSNSNNNSVEPVISANGQYVAFQSYANNLVTDDTNLTGDIFVHDLNSATTERVSVDTSGNQANNISSNPSMSADGRYVTFHSTADNLVQDDTNDASDVFVHDRDTGLTERVSVDSSGNEGNNTSRHSAISADGRYVTFYSNADNLVPGDTNSTFDIFVHDRDTGITEPVNFDILWQQTSSTSSQAPAISGDGRYLTFYILVNYLATITGGDPTFEIIIYDRNTGTGDIISVDSSGSQSNDNSFNPAISADGRFVTFYSAASNLVTDDTNGDTDIFVHDRDTGITERVSIDSAANQGNGISLNPAISANGRYVTFHSHASNLVSNDTNSAVDIFVHNRDTGSTERVSIGSADNQSNGNSHNPSISADGRNVTFSSIARNLVPGDVNQFTDIFVRTRSTRVAQYQADFASSQNGWLYQWNADVPIGQSVGYVDMKWDRWKYDSDGLPGLPDTSGLAYGHFSAGGGHTGQGTSNGELDDRYVIAGFMISKTGEYMISESQIVHTGCEFGNGGVVEIYVDDRLINSFIFESKNKTSFDGNIGPVDLGSIIYVAVGPNGNDGCDGFDWDYVIEIVEGITANQPPVLNNPGDQINKIGDNIQLLLNATDPDEDVLSFGATRLPTGLSIDSQSGLISGTISPTSLISTHNVSVTVNDNQGKTHTVSFNWIVNTASTIVARYSTDFADQPATGWSYQWNPNVPIGQSNGYVDLQWAHYLYDSDGVKGLPDNSGLAYGNLDLEGGHPGRGTLQGETDDRFVIAGYTVASPGEYQINDSSVMNIGCAYGNGSIVKVYVDDNLIDSLIFNLGGEISFDVNLGMVEAGSTIYVALGPNSKDGCDGVLWDYAIELN